jgi:hypothetical protein
VNYFCVSQQLCLILSLVACCARSLSLPSLLHAPPTYPSVCLVSLPSSLIFSPSISHTHFLVFGSCLVLSLSLSHTHTHIRSRPLVPSFLLFCFSVLPLFHHFHIIWFDLSLAVIFAFSSLNPFLPPILSSFLPSCLPVYDCKLPEEVLQLSHFVASLYATNLTEKDK